MKHLALASAWLSIASAGVVRADEDGLTKNPFECQGTYEGAIRDHNAAQIRRELEQRLHWVREPDDPPAVRAVAACVVARLMVRLGISDAATYFAMAIAAAPDEPGYELFFGTYWSGARGARRPVTSLAEQHYAAALAKLDLLRGTPRWRGWHTVVEDQTRKRLLALYQTDGLPLSPATAYSARADQVGGIGAALSTQLTLARDSRDFFFNNEARQFTGEAAFAASDVRKGALDARTIWDIPRAPWRWQIDNRVRLRHPTLGALDAMHGLYRSEASQITSFYTPTEGLSDVQVQQVGIGLDRGFAIDPLFDVRLLGSIKRIERRGVVEFLPNLLETFNAYEARPSVARFLGPNKLTMDGVYVLLDITDVKGGVPAQRLRQKIIRAVKLDYAIYAPVPLPSWSGGGPGLRPTGIRGWHLYGGAAIDDEIYGLRTVTARDVYLGTRFEGSRRLDWTLQGTWYDSMTSLADPNDVVPTLYLDPAQSFSSGRLTALAQWRLVNPDETPGLPRSTGLAVHGLNLVLPVNLDRTLTGRADYENVRAGVELWIELISLDLRGTSFLVTAGYDLQYFTRIDKVMHMGHMAVRMGWGEL